MFQEDIEKPEEYKKIYQRLTDLSNFGPSFKPVGNFNMFEFYDRTGIQIEELLLTCSYRNESYDIMRKEF